MTYHVQHTLFWILYAADNAMERNTYVSSTITVSVTRILKWNSSSVHFGLEVKYMCMYLDRTIFAQVHRM